VLKIAAKGACREAGICWSTHQTLKRKKKNRRKPRGSRRQNVQRLCLEVTFRAICIVRGPLAPVSAPYPNRPPLIDEPLVLVIVEMPAGRFVSLMSTGL